MHSTREFANQVARELHRRGHVAYLVGGCVRDLLLNRTPTDYDLATDATPEQVRNIFPVTFAVGEQFGVVLVVDQVAGHSIEVATFRSDEGYSDGRHPDSVRFAGSLEEDVRRRDFTINGMAMDPVTGDVFDYVGGREDLKNGSIRAIGDPRLRFTEDKLRMLRAVRFAARLGYNIEPETFASIKTLASGVRQVSSERIREELTKMLVEGSADRAIRLLDEAALLIEVLPEISAMKGVEQPPEFHPEGDVYVHTLLLLRDLPSNSPPTLAWGALLHDVGKPATFRLAPDRIRFDGHVEVGVALAKQICRRLRFSNEDTEQIVALVEHHMRFGQSALMKESTFKRFVRLPNFDKHLALHRLDCMASHKDLSLYDFVRERMANMPPEAIRPSPLVNGNDLIALGLKPGPKFKAILTEFEDAQLEGSLNTRQEALDRLQSRVNEGVITD